jgi:exosortase A-associated hydrolase 1
MRQLTSFACEGATLGATYDHGERTTGLLMVTGGTELRAGANSGMARLSAVVAAAGYPVLRFDRRGVGDSDGVDPGFRGSGPDIATAAATFRTLRPDLQRLVGFGLCDGATALALAHASAGVDALALANPWVVESEGDMPPPAAVARRYRQRLCSTDGWRRVLTGDFDVPKALRGVRSLLKPRDMGLAATVAASLERGRAPLSVILATRDATAIAFEREWRRAAFVKTRNRPSTRLVLVDSCSHSFASSDDHKRLAAFCIDALEQSTARR